MIYPPISCVMATRDRVSMAARALAMFALQDYPGRKEMVVVDTGARPIPDRMLDEASEMVDLRHVRGVPGGALGSALNLGVRAATGTVIHKWDDDDLYGAGFLRHAVEKAQGGPDEDGTACVVWERFLVITPDGVTRISGNRMCGGGSLVFLREALDHDSPFPDVATRVDAAVVGELERRYGARAMTRVADAPEMYTVVRHGGNMWRKLATVAEVRGRMAAVEVNVDDVLRTLPVWKGGRT